jgi:hypothetical protein
MESAMAIAAVLGPVWLIMGLSILFYNEAWQKLHKHWGENHLHLLPLMLMAMVLGLIIMRMYSDWTWNKYILVTLAGWGAFLKGVIYFLAPGSMIKSMLSMGNSKGFLYFGGLVAVIFGAVLTHAVYWA